MKILFSNQWGVRSEDLSLLDYTNLWMGDSYTAGMRALKQLALNYGIVCEPMRENNKSEADAFCIWEAPRISTGDRQEENYRAILQSGKPLYAFLTEPQPVDPENGLLSNTLFYNKMFTWRRDLIDGYKYYSIRPMWFDFGRPLRKTFKDKKQYVMIGHILSDIFISQNAIYSRRKEILDWFLINHPEDIAAYGKQAYGVGQLKQYPFFKGATGNKRETLSMYKFSFCYENSRYDDYITEKLFDCFLSGCVPIYIGAPNVTDYISSNCFVNADDFDNFEDLYSYLNTMTEREYLRYLESAEAFLGTPFARSYKPEVFAETVLKVLMNDLEDVSL
jgi:hypothetical protein